MMEKALWVFVEDTGEFQKEKRANWKVLQRENLSGLQKWQEVSVAGTEWKKGQYVVGDMTVNRTQIL